MKGLVAIAGDYDTVPIERKEPIDVDHDSCVVLFGANRLGIDNDECADPSFFE
jgi:hypothetical protein